MNQRPHTIAASPVNASMYVSQIASVAELRNLEADWNELTSGIPFRTYQWLVTWWEHYGNNVNAGHRNSLLVLAVYDSKDRSKLIAIAPCFVEYRWSEGRVVRFLGSGEVCSEYLSVLCRTGFESQVAHQLVDWLTGPGAGQWDAIEFSDVASDDSVVCEMAQRAIAVGNSVCRYASNGCWKLHLPDSWDEYLSSLSKSHRKRVRRLERQMINPGRAQHRRVTNRNELSSATATFLQLHQRRRASLGEDTSLNSARFTAFLTVVAERMFDLGKLHLNLLELDGRIVAAEYNLASGGIVYGFQSGIDPDALGDEPGNLLTITTIRNAIRDGYGAYDLLRGDEPYKAHWRAQLQTTFGVRIANKSLVAHVRHRTWLCRHKIIQWARQLASCIRDFRKTRLSSNKQCRDIPRQPRAESAGAANRPSLHVTKVSNLDGLEALKTEWDELAGDVALRRFDWLVTWWRYFGAGDSSKQLFVLSVRDGSGRLQGLAPWYLQESAPRGQVIRFLGSGVVCTDYATVLCRPGCEANVSQAITEWLEQQTDTHWSLIELTGVDQTDVMVQRLAAQLGNHGHTVHVQAADSCWRVALPATWEQYVDTLTAKKRAHVRRAVRNMFDTDRVKLHVVEDADQMDRAFEIFRDLHQKRRESVGDVGCFSNPAFAGFLRDVADRFWRAGRLDLLWIELDGEPVAVEFNPIGGGVIYGYQGGVDPEALRTRPGPGNLINIARIRRAIERGDQALDFLRGDEPYKLEWQAARIPLVEYRIVPARSVDQMRHRFWLGAQQGRRWAKRVWQRTEQWQHSAMTAANDWFGRMRQTHSRSEVKG